jgi:hypothetical protein
VIKPPSLTVDYHLVFSGDPALDKPEEPTRGPGEEHEPWMARAKAFYELPPWKAWRESLRIARDTGSPERWRAMLKPGTTPTLFIMRQVPGVTWRKIHDRLVRQEIGTSEAAALCFRAAIVGFKDLGVDIKITQATDPDIRERIATPDVVTALDAIHAGIVSELGDLVFQRMNAPSPLS